MKKKPFALLLVLVGLALATAVPTVGAQDAPQAVREAAIQAVQNITGRTDRPTNWTWLFENGVSTTDLNCPLTEGSALGRIINVYVITLNFGGVEYGVRVSADATLVQPCDAKLIDSNDSDGDGVPNDTDACPNQGEGTYGLGPNGCPVNDPVAACNLTAGADCNDPDGDGVPNYFDSCPQQFGSLPNQGCPPGGIGTNADTDADGILDNADACPLDYGLVANQGCPQGSAPQVIPPTAAPQPTPSVQVTCLVSIVTETSATSGPGWEYPGGFIPPLGENTQWTATGVSTDDIWFQVKKDGQDVWLPASSGYQLALGKVAVQSTVYDGPSTSNTAVLTVQPGTLVYLISESADGQWHAIQVENQTGWVPKQAINQIPAIQLAMQVTTTTGPGADAPAANLLPAVAGDIFELTAATNGWYRLNVNGQEAWVPATMALPLQPDCANLPVIGTGGGGVVESTADPTPAAGDGPCIVATKQEPRLYAAPNFNQPNSYIPQITTPVAYRGLVLVNFGEWYGVFDVAYGVQYIHRDDVLRTSGDCVGLPSTQDANVTTTITNLNSAICMLVPRTLTINVRAQPTVESTRLVEIPAEQNLMALGKWDVWYLSTRGWLAEWVVDEEVPCLILPSIAQFSMEPDPAHQANIAPPGTSGGAASQPPASQQLTQYACPPDFAGYMPPKIGLGTGNARLSQGGIPNKLRETPTVTGAQVGVIQPGRTLNQVINGPACSDGFVWWYVELDGTFGWTAESSYLTKEYWIEPVR